jgi:hypothetical protein
VVPEIDSKIAAPDNDGFGRRVMNVPSPFVTTLDANEADGHAAETRRFLPLVVARQALECRREIDLPVHDRSLPLGAVGMVRPFGWV